MNKRFFFKQNVINSVETNINNDKNFTFSIYLIKINENHFKKQCQSIFVTGIKKNFLLNFGAETNIISFDFLRSLKLKIKLYK